MKIEKKDLPSNSKSLNFAIIPAFSAGLEDSLNPCALTTILLFVMFLSVFGRDPKQIKYLGIWCLVSFYVTSLLAVLGAFDFALAPIQTHIVLQRMYLLLSGIIFILGAVSFYDWWVYRKKKDLRNTVIKFPAIIMQANQPAAVMGRSLKVKLALFASFFGLGAGLLATTWPPSASLGVIYFKLMMPTQRIAGFISFLFYTLAYVLPLIVSFFLIVQLTQSKKMFSSIENSISKVKIVSSAVFFGFSLGLFYTFF